jgi:hypothetical protein
MRTCPLNSSLFLSWLRSIWMVREPLDVVGGTPIGPRPIKSKCLSWVNRVALTARRSLPVFPD